MTREGVTYEAFSDAYTELETQGLKPTLMKIRELLGQGSYSTLGRYLKERLSDKKIEEAVATPATVSAAVDDIWQRLTKEADEKVVRVKAEAEASVQAAEKRACLGEARAQEAIAARQALEEKHHAVIGERELLSLDFKRQKETYVSLQASHISLNEKFTLLQEESQAHLITLRSLQERELKSYAERIVELEANHKKELCRLLERQESDRHRLIVELDQSRAEIRNRDRALHSFEITLLNMFKDIEQLNYLYGQALTERDQLKEKLLSAEMNWNSELEDAANSENHLKLIQDLVGGVGQSVLDIVKKLDVLTQLHELEYKAESAGV
jgi:hypothetical protein